MEGWECPRCHMIHAPFIRECNCSALPINTQGCLWDSMPETKPGSGIKIAYARIIQTHIQAAV